MYIPVTHFLEMLILNTDCAFLKDGAVYLEVVVGVLQPDRLND
jgi:hypothetical protein